MSSVLITGANRGIGLALCQHLCARGDKVIATCRQLSPALERTGARIEAGIDVTDAAALAGLAQRLGDTRIDRLWLNAGVLIRDFLATINPTDLNGLTRQFEVNALGPLRVALTLLGQLAEGSKIAIITSRMGSIADNDSGGYYGYRASKAAANALGKSLALDLAPRGIGVFMLHPGYVATDMAGANAQVLPADAAAQLVAQLKRLEFSQTGSFWHANGSALPW